LRAALWRNARLAALGAALARVSHDLRGILAPALLSAERLQGNTDPALRRIGDSIARTVERATELMRNTLDFAGEVPAPPRERVALRDLVQEVGEEVRTRHPLLQVAVRIDASLAAQGDRASLRRALANLLRNAAEAGARQVEVAAAPDGDLVLLTVTDDGPGLPEVVRASLFQPFVTSGKKGGTGLGLAITRDLVRAQGGEIGLVRTTPQGTMFRLALRTPAGATG
jgi:signal transduction histidine kinase